MSYYTISRGTQRWWLKLTFNLLENAVVNAYILAKNVSSTDSLTQLSFRKQLAVQLCKVSSQSVTPANIGRPSLPETPERLLGEHFPDKLSKKVRCVVCMERMTTRVHDSHYGCQNCAMHLCMETSTKS